MPRGSNQHQKGMKKGEERFWKVTYLDGHVMHFKHAYTPTRGAGLYGKSRGHGIIKSCVQVPEEAVKDKEIFMGKSVKGIDPSIIIQRAAARALAKEQIEKEQKEKVLTQHNGTGTEIIPVVVDEKSEPEMIIINQQVEHEDLDNELINLIISATAADSPIRLRLDKLFEFCSESGSNEIYDADFLIYFANTILLCIRQLEFEVKKIIENLSKEV